MALRRPIFPESCPSSIVGAGAFHDRVRDGNGWVHAASVTRHVIEVKGSQAAFRTPPPEADTSRTRSCRFGLLVAYALSPRPLVLLS